MRKALADNPNVFLYGQDIGSFGGAFKATKNLAEEFPGRVLDAPLSEDAIIGIAIGAAIEGMRPIVEMQFADFSTCGFNQIVNQAATLFYRTEVSCPIVVRLPLRRHIGRRAFSQPEHGGAVCALSRSGGHDARHGGRRVRDVARSGGDRRPGDFCEHKLLYNHLKAESLPEETLPIGKARIARHGRDTTIVAYGAMVHESLKAAEELAEDGYNIEVVDLRTVKPIDNDTILASVARTGRLLCVSEAYGRGVAWRRKSSPGSRRRAFGLLDAPPQRLNAEDPPVPYHRDLWSAHRPNANATASATRRLLEM